VNREPDAKPLRSIVIGTAGHIDHGKSALVRALTGTDPDRLKEEQARGITIDLGFAHLVSGDVNLAFVDVPGHERFVKNMLAGAGGIDLVMLIVAADESVMPQTREHFQICRLLEVPAGVIVLTKSDVADQEMQDLAALEVREMVADSFLADAPIIPTSSVTGRGLEDLKSVLARLAAGLPVRPSEGPVRMPIDRVFTVKGFGTVVTGTLVRGEIRDEQELVVLPRGLPVKVRGVQVHGRHESSAAAGRRVAVNIGGIDVTDLARGDTLATPGSLEPTRRVDVALDLLPDARTLRHGTRLRFHQGTTEVLGRVALSGPRRDEGTAADVLPGGSAYARVRLESPAVLMRGDRFIVRAYSPTVTIGGGVVLDPQPPRGAIRTESGRARFRAIEIDRAGEDEALASFVEERGMAGLPRASLVSRAGLMPREADEAVARLTQRGRALLIGDLLVTPRVVETLTTGLVNALDAHHRAQPLSDGLPREEARERIFGRAAPAVFEHVLHQLVASGRIVARDRLALAGHQIALSAEEANALGALERVYRDAGLAPPDLPTAAAAAGVKPDIADRMVRLLLRRNALAKLDTLFFHTEPLELLKREVRGLKLKGTARVDVAAFKERYAITRKFAIPLLEYLDRERVTRRAGDSRVIL
jgi:selenocysteine-specific elongation factor